MKHLLPTDKKTIAMGAWLFYAERGFDVQLLHHQDAEEIEIIVTYEDSQELPFCQLLMHSSFNTEIVRIGSSDKVYRCTITEVFI